MPKLFRAVVLFLSSMMLALPMFGKDAQLKPADIISRHLASIGTPEARAAAKSRTIRGTVTIRSVLPAAASADGNAFIVSIGQRFSIAARFSSAEFPGEQFVFDGSKAQIALIAPARRSILGDFFYRQDQILRDGLLGGALTTSWALLDISDHRPELKYEGLKKIGDRELHDLLYVPKKSDRDLIIHLYFDPETFRHVKTVYEFTVSPQFSHNQLRHGDTGRYRVEENFSDFRTVDGLTLPYKWELRWTLSTTATTESEWEVNVTGVTHNNVTD